MAESEIQVEETITAAKNCKARGRSKPGPRDLLGRFGPYLERRRKEQLLSIRQLAKKAKTAHSNVFKFEKEGKNPRLTELEALAKAFNEPLDKFLQPVLSSSQAAIGEEGPNDIRKMAESQTDRGAVQRQLLDCTTLGQANSR